MINWSLLALTLNPSPSGEGLTTNFIFEALLLLGEKEPEDEGTSSVLSTQNSAPLLSALTTGSRP